MTKSRCVQTERPKVRLLFYDHIICVRSLIRQTWTTVLEYHCTLLYLFCYLFLCLCLCYGLLSDSEISPYRNLSLTLSVAQRRGSSVFSTRPIVRHTRWNVSFIHQRLYAKSKGPNSVCHVFTFSLCGKIQAMVLKQWFKSAIFVDKKSPMGHVIVIL